MAELKIPTLPKSGSMIKKYHQQHYFKRKADDEWIRVEKSTANTITMNPQTQEFDYITDENPTTEIDKYQPSMSHPITMYKGHKDFETVFDLMYNMATGADAHLDFLTIFFARDEMREGVKVFRAWKNDAVFSVGDVTPTDSVINVDVNFAGTVEKGVVKMTGDGPEFIADKVDLPEDSGEEKQEEDADGPKEEQDNKTSVTFMDYNGGDAKELLKVDVEKGVTLQSVLDEKQDELALVVCKDNNELGHWSDSEKGEKYDYDSQINDALVLYPVSQDEALG